MADGRQRDPSSLGAGRALASSRARLAALVAASALFATALSLALQIAIGTARIRADAADQLAADWSTATHAVVTLPEARRTVERARDIVHLFDGRDLVEAALIAPEGAIRDRSVPLRRADPAPGWFSSLLAGPMLERRYDLPGIGTIRLQANPARAIDRLWWDCLLQAGLVLAGSAAAGALGIAAAGRFSRALGHVERAVDRVGEGHLDPPAPPPLAPPEVRSLAASLARMSERLRTVRDRDARIAAQRSAAEDEERRALARDLHDEIGPLLFAVDVDAGALRALAAEADPAELRAEVAARAAAIETAAAAMKREVRAILGQLRPGAAMKIGLEHALRDVVAFFGERHPTIAFTVTAPDDGWGGTIDGALIAIVRESVSNALRHGDPTRIDVEVAVRDALIRLKVADDGGGLKVRSDPGTGYGILGMRERAAALGGRLLVENRLDRPGVVVSATIPPPA